MLRGRPLRFGGERIRWRSIPQALVLFRHDDSRVFGADLADVNGQSRHLDTIRIFECSDLEDLGIDGAGGGFHVCRVFGFGGVVGRGHHRERIVGGSVTYDLWVGLGFVVCCMGLRTLEVPCSPYPPRTGM